MAGNIFRNFVTKWRQGHVKHVSLSSKMHVVRQMAHETLKIANVKHAVVFADGAPEANSAQVMSHNQNVEGLNKRRNSDRNGQKSDKSKSNDKTCSYRGRSGVKKMEFSIKSA